MKRNFLESYNSATFLDPLEREADQLEHLHLRTLSQRAIVVQPELWCSYFKVDASRWCLQPGYMSHTARKVHNKTHHPGGPGLIMRALVNTLRGAGFVDVRTLPIIVGHSGT